MNNPSSPSPGTAVDMVLNYSAGDIEAERARRRFSAYVEYTSDIILERWQHIYCDRLQRLKDERGQRILLHGPPQFGKSMIVSQRLPSWLLGHDPGHRIRNACYNQSKAETFSGVNLEIMQSKDYQAVFPNPGCRVPDRCARDEWYTAKRRLARDAQSSFKAVGIRSGLVGTGIDLLIVDDPYANRMEAFSTTTNEGVWNWWKEVVAARANPDSNILVLFHRWKCLLPDSQVLTPEGTRVIKDLVPGDAIITSKGVQHIQGAASKLHEGDIISVRTFGQLLPLSTTPDHRYFTECGWIEAQQLTGDDWIACPIAQHTTPYDAIRAKIPAAPISKHERLNVSALPLARAAVSKVVLEDLYVKQGLTCKEVAARLGFGTGQAIQRYVTAYGLNRPEGNVLTGDPVVDPEFWWVVGLWLAEGAFSQGRPGAKKDMLKFCLGPTEQVYADKVKRVLEQYGIRIQIKANKQGLNVNGSSTQLAAFLREFGELAHFKFIPEWVIGLPDNLLQQLLAGYAAGDGEINKKYVRFVTCSYSLALTTQRALAKLHVVSAIMKSTCGYEIRAATIDAPWIVAASREADTIMSDIIVPTRSQTIKIIGGNMFFRVKAITRSHYSGLVYDIQTPSHDFVAQGMTVHNCDDLAGRLIEQGGWEQICFPAICDEDPYDPTFTSGARKAGESLSPRYSVEFLLDVEKNIGGPAFASLFQGKPVMAGGNMFKRHWFKRVSRSEIPAGARRVRWWDKAGSEGMGDFTVGLLMAYHANIFYIEDVVRGQWGIDDRDRTIKQTADGDAARYGRGAVKQWSEQEPGSAGKESAQNFVRLLVGHAAYFETSTGSKSARAEPLASQAAAGNVCVVEADWTETFLSEVTIFPGGRNDDQLDGAAGALSKLIAQGWFEDPDALAALLSRGQAVTPRAKKSEPVIILSDEQLVFAPQGAKTDGIIDQENQENQENQESQESEANPSDPNVNALLLRYQELHNAFIAELKDKVRNGVDVGGESSSSEITETVEDQEHPSLESG